VLPFEQHLRNFELQQATHFYCDYSKSHNGESVQTCREQCASQIDEQTLAELVSSTAVGLLRGSFLVTFRFCATIYPGTSYTWSQEGGRHMTRLGSEQLALPVTNNYSTTRTL